MNLKDIRDSSQKVAEAISAILKLDVTIIDSNMLRVAATGKYQDKVGYKLPANCYFEIIAREKKAQFVKEANFSSKCEACSSRGNCKEMGSLGYPILDQDKLIGVIGVLAFNQEQKNIIEDKYDSLLIFLNRLSQLLIANLKYEDTIDRLILQDKFTKTILDEIDSGIILTDSEGIVQSMNSRAERLLNLSDERILNQSISSIIPNFNINKDYNIYKEYKFNSQLGLTSLMLKNIPIQFRGKNVNNIIKLTRTSSMIKNAYTIMEESRKIGFEDIIGESSQINSVKELAKNVSKSNSTIMLRGESGTGKDLFARAIHENSHRKNSPFIVVNCASIPDSLLESEFFGYEEGAFTGAKKEGHIGKFELANGGSLFLDEIGDMPLHLQPKILRVIQNKSFVKIGGKEIINTDFRLITATNKNLEEMIKENSFREDLYYRLNVIPIHIPKLIEREGDLLLLIDYFMQSHCMNLRIEKKKFTPDALAQLEAYSWPGNIRELENMVEFLANTVESNIIRVNDLPKKILDKTSCSKIKDSSLEDMMDEFEREILIKKLQEYGSSTHAKKLIAEKLEINLSTLYRKLNKHGINSQS